MNTVLISQLRRGTHIEIQLEEVVGNKYINGVY